VRAREGERVTATDGHGQLTTLVVERSRPDVVVTVIDSRLEPAPVHRVGCCAARPRANAAIGSSRSWRNSA
jgi:hypothetical protein